MFTRRALWILAAAAFAAPAQDSRSVSGIVADNRGNPLPGAAVQIENSRTLEIASYLTRDDGKYYFHQLSP